VRRPPPLIMGVVSLLAYRDGLSFVRLNKKVAGRAVAIVACLGLLIIAGASAASTSTSVPNASFEDGWFHGKIRCWNVTPAAASRLTVTGHAHSGSWAAYASAARPTNGQLELTTDRTDGCQIPVNAKRSYTLDLWARSTAGAQPVVYTYSGLWRRWYVGDVIPPAPALRDQKVALPAIPEGVTRVSVGMVFPGSGVVVMDDVTLTPIDSTLFQPSFTPESGLITNEFAYWNAHKPSAVISPDWEMTSGSLFGLEGGGYTGRIDDQSPDADSLRSTNSAIFRLNTRNHSFQDVLVTMKLNLVRLVSTGVTPKVDWDGVHLFLRYQSQFELYYASVARRDGHVVIKKKCRGGDVNGGTYYSLGSSELSGWSMPLGTWHSVGATVRTNHDGSVTIELYRDDKVITTATDTGIGCPPITNAGATGIRGDNAEFKFRDFMVAPIS
jgi:hypothetical protein